MKRKLFDVATLTSVVLCAVVIAGWLRSYYVYDTWTVHFYRRGNITRAGRPEPLNRSIAATYGSTRGGMLFSCGAVWGDIIPPDPSTIITHTLARIYPHLSDFGGDAKGWELLGICYARTDQELGTPIDIVSRYKSVVIPYALPSGMLAMPPLCGWFCFESGGKERSACCITYARAAATTFGPTWRGAPSAEKINGRALAREADVRLIQSHPVKNV